MVKEEQTSNREKRGADPEKATIFDVAEKAGVSFVSVSRVFNEHPNVSLKMREKVLSAARAVGYQPRLVCRPSLIAVLTSNQNHDQHGCDQRQLCSKIFSAAARRNYLMEVITMDQLDLLTQHLIDGVIEVGVGHQALYTLKEIPKIPLVTTQNRTFQPSWSSITIDYDAEGRMAIEPLLEAGHRKIAVVVDRLYHWPSQQRVEGMRSLLKERHISEEAVDLFDLCKIPLWEVGQRVAKNGFTALVNFASDEVHALVDILFNELKLGIPKKLSLVTLDNTELCSHYHPRISFVRQPLDALADQAVAELQKLILKQTKNRNLFVQSTYHARNTVRPPPK